MFKVTPPKSQIYLTRRNLLTLLSKLDRQALGDKTECTIIKYKSPAPEYQQTMGVIMITAVQDEDYYSALDRAAGVVHPLDDPKRIKIINEV